MKNIWPGHRTKNAANRLYHWTHLELRRPFGITGTLFDRIPRKAFGRSVMANRRSPAFSARGIMQQMNVRMVGTTDDPIDSSEYHRQIATDDSIDIEVAPSWRPATKFSKSN